MKPLNNAIILLAMIGAIGTTLSILGSFGIGNFRLYYGPDILGCTKMEQAEINKNQNNIRSLEQPGNTANNIKELK